MGIKDTKIQTFLEQLSSKAPTPGGGAVAALAGAMAASLVEMVINISKDEGLNKNLRRTKNLRAELLKLADEDVAAFDEVMAAYKSKSLPRIKKALEDAIEVPEKTKAASGEVEKLAMIVAQKGNKNALSDASTAVLLSRAAQESAQENIKINKLALKKL